MLISINHAHLHLNMEGIAGPVRHVILKLVVVHDDVRLITISELRALDMYNTAGRANVLVKFVSNENHWALVAFDHEN